MAIKIFKYSGMNLIQESLTFSNYTCNSDDGLVYTPSTPVLSTDSVVGVASHTHHAFEGPDILWTGVKCNLTHSSSPVQSYQNIISLYGYGGSHTPELVGEKIYNTITTTPTTVSVNFDLLSSACQAPLALTSSQTTPGTIRLNLPMRYNNHFSDAYLTRDWYNTSWTKRRMIPITGSSSGDLMDYVVRNISITYDSDMNADFSDIRFTDSDGVTLINHNCYTKTDSTSAKFDVEIPTLYQAGVRNIYMYYGNSEATDTSTTTIYELYDALDSLTGWTTVVGTWSDGGDYIRNVGAGAVARVKKSYTQSGYISYRFKLRRSEPTPGAYSGFIFRSPSTNYNDFDQGVVIVFHGPPTSKIEAYESTGGTLSGSPPGAAYTFTEDTWYDIEIKHMYGLSSNNLIVYVEGIAILTTHSTGYSVGDVVRFLTSGTADSGWDFDQLFITQTVAAEPTVGSVSGEEATTTNTVTPTTAQDIDTFLMFTTPTDWQARTPTKLTITPYGGSAYTTNTTYVSNRSILELGYDGMDKYDGMGLSIETTTTSTPFTVSIDDLEYSYEV